VITTGCNADLVVGELVLGRLDVDVDVVCAGGGLRG
jgi:hypothetical protein